MTAPAIAPTIVEADLQNPVHQQAIVSLINHYAQEPVIGGKPLPERVQTELIAGLQQHPTTEIFLAFLDSQPIGIAVCFRGFSTFAAKPLLNIHDLAVHAEHRGQGVGRALLAAVEAKAQATGCCRITLEVVENNENAQRVYESVGFASNPGKEANGRMFFMEKSLAAKN